jgi:hypothetical protein
MPRKQTLVYQIKVTLIGTHPPVWRRIVVPGNTTLLKLHDILQIVMGWEDYHLHLFTLDGENYGDPEDDEYGLLGTMPEQNYRLSELIHGEGQRFVYKYDFGDGWIHGLRVENVGPAREGVRYPVCMAGRRACPPEDVGGIGGYARFLEAIRDPDDPEHDEYLQWVGGEFDPEEFDLEPVNEQLRRMGRGRSTEALGKWSVFEPEPDESARMAAAGARWIDNLPAEQWAVAEELPLRRDVVVLLTYLRDNRVTGTSALGNLPLKAVRAICAQFVDPPPMEERIGDHVYSVRTELEVWPLYFRHVLASLALLIEGAAGRRWRLTPLGETYLTASAPKQLWVLWFTWWMRTNWGIASPHDLREYQVWLLIQQTLNHLLDVQVGESVPFKAFANSLIDAAGLIPPGEDPEEAKRGLRHTIRRVVMGPLADFGVLETREDPKRGAMGGFWLVSSFRVTPFGHGLLKAIESLHR